MTYEGAHSIIGPYLRDLGATGFQVAVIAGLGEMIAASLRFFSGRYADQTKAYWTITFFGYAMNVIAVPGARVCAELANRGHSGDRGAHRKSDAWTGSGRVAV
jgi:hypothetical protein